jgi:hypothetical protein
MAILSLWHQESPENHLCCLLVGNYGNYETKIVEKDMNLEALTDLILSENDYKSVVLFMTVPPFQQLIECCARKGIGKIIYITDKNPVKSTNGVILQPFMHTFGKIIDILSSYKPKDITIDKV